MLGLRARPELSAELDARGALYFSGEGFSNTGEKIRRGIEIRGIDIQLSVAEALRGRVVREFDRFALDFEAGNSLTGRAILFQVELARLDVDADRVIARFTPGFEIYVDLVGELPSVGEA